MVGLMFEMRPFCLGVAVCCWVPVMLNVCGTIQGNMPDTRSIDSGSCMISAISLHAMYIYPPYLSNSSGNSVVNLLQCSSRLNESLSPGFYSRSSPSIACPYLCILFQRETVSQSLKQMGEKILPPPPPPRPKN